MLLFPSKYILRENGKTRERQKNQTAKCVSIEIKKDG
jgi:hypothetical protein